MEMVYSKSGLHLTEGFEALRLTAYQDQRGIWTIAWGHTRGVKPGDTCTPAQAAGWLQEDITIAAACVNRLVTVALTQGEFDALTDFVFNLGCGDFQGSTLLRLLNSGNYSGAAAQLDRWDHIGAKESAGLLRRREDETQEFQGV